jgi:hypothetical protein
LLERRVRRLDRRGEHVAAVDDVQRPGANVDVLPAQRERLSDPLPAAGEQREQDTADS